MNNIAWRIASVTIEAIYAVGIVMLASRGVVELKHRYEQRRDRVNAQLDEGIDLATKVGSVESQLDALKEKADDSSTILC